MPYFKGNITKETNGMTSGTSYSGTSYVRVERAVHNGKQEPFLVWLAIHLEIFNQQILMEEKNSPLDRRRLQE